MEDVEDEVGHRCLLHAPLHLAGRGHVHARLQALEAGPSLGVEGDDLTVDDGGATGQLLAHGRHLRVLGGDVEEVAALDARPVVVHVDEGADAVPLELVGVGRVVVGQAFGEGRLHRLQPAGERVGQLSSAG